MTEYSSRREGFGWLSWPTSSNLLALAVVVAALLQTACNQVGQILMSEDEREYYRETNADLGTDPLSLATRHIRASDIRSEADLWRECTAAWEEPVAFTSAALRRARDRNVPNLYRDFNVIIINYWKAIEPLIQDVSDVGQSICREAQRRAINVRDSSHANLVMEQVYGEHESRIVALDERTKAILATYRLLMDREQAKMDAEFKRRFPDPLNLRNGGSNPSAQPDVHVTFRPYMVPVAITVNSAGEVNLSAENNIPTPIGVVSVGAGVTVRRQKLLRVRHAGRDSLWALADAPFVFVVKDYAGDISIKYSSEEVLVELTN